MAEKALVLRSAQQTPANLIMRMQLLRSPFWLHSLQSIVHSYRLLQVPATLHATTQQKEHILLIKACTSVRGLLAV
jgi:hypothetical protein